jgi:hypothetical protein
MRVSRDLARILAPLFDVRFELQSLVCESLHLGVVLRNELPRSRHVSRLVIDDLTGMFAANSIYPMDIWVFARHFSLQLAVPEVSLGRIDVRANGNDWALFPDCDDQLGVNVSIPCSAQATFQQFQSHCESQRQSSR